MDRQACLAALKTTEFDLLVVGGGATGSGIALDAASRGLKVALVDKNDFSEGTSSRSTKLVHGGVRYLEAAVKRLDRGQYNLVRDGLRERALLLKNAPHLAHRLALVTPAYRWWELPYLYAGLRLYDLLAGKRGLGRSRLLGRKETMRRFPALKAEGLKGGVLYYDGQFNDARMNIALVMTAVAQGAVAANHVEVAHLDKIDGKVVGARVMDRLSGEAFPVRAKGVINATGPFADGLRMQDNPKARLLLRVSSGTHIVLDRRFAPPDTGMVIPRTEDGRLLFVLPWEGHTLVGTTDEKARVDEHPQPSAKEIDYLLGHVRQYVHPEVTRGDIKAAWAGLRPLVSDPKTADTAHLVRDHYVETASSGLLTITGGKWTTYRKMAQDAVDQAIESFGLEPLGGCRTTEIPLQGSGGYGPALEEQLKSEYRLADATVTHLVAAYGDRAAEVAKLARQGYGGELVDGHPYLEAEVVYAARDEMACRVMDVLARRLSLACLDQRATRHAVDRTLDLLASVLGWNEQERQTEKQRALERLEGAI